MTARHTTIVRLLPALAGTLLFAMRPACADDSSNATDFEHPERRAYRVTIELALADGVLSGDADRARLRDGVANACRRTFGAAWEPRVVANGWLAPVSPRGLERLAVDDLIARYESKPVDKVFLVAVEDRLGTFHVHVREFDVATRQLGPVVGETARGRDRLAGTIFHAVHDAFEPVASIESVERDAVELVPLAGGFRFPDPSAKRLSAGDFVVPHLRYVSHEGEVRRLRTFPWTYVRVGERDGAAVAGTLTSGLRLPLGGPPKRTIQKLALATRPRFPQTTVRLFPRGSAGQPYVATNVEVVRKLLPDAEADREPESLLSDRDGRIAVSRDAEEPLAWLYVRSGRELLARVPLLVGSVAEADFPLPDDGPRLEFEGTVELLQANLVDAVARREGLVRRIRILAREGDWDHVDSLIADLRALPTIREFEDRLTILRTRQLAKADAADNRVAALRIRRLAEQTEELANRYLDPQRIEDLLSEVNDLRGLDARDAREFGR